MNPNIASSTFSPLRSFSACRYAFALWIPAAVLLAWAGFAGATFASMLSPADRAPTAEIRAAS